MKSKLIVNLDVDGKPCITVTTPLQSSGFNSADFNLADRTLGMFFENLQIESPFLGLIRNPDTDDSKVRTIVPLTIPGAIEWMCVFFRSKFEGKNEEASEEVLEVFDKLKRMYFNEGEYSK